MGKDIFRKHGVPVPDGYVVENASELKPFEKPVVVKSQILLGGRGKSGGIKFAKNQDELKNSANELIGSKIRDLTVTKVLVEEMINIKKELYVSIALNRSERAPLLIASASGGVEIESVPENEIFKKKIDPLMGYSDYIGREAVSFLKLEPSIASQFTKCDTVAKGIVAAKEKCNIQKPSVVRLSGIHEEEGRKILSDNGIESYPGMMKAIERVVQVAGGN